MLHVVQIRTTYTAPFDLNLDFIITRISCRARLKTDVLGCVHNDGFHLHGFTVVLLRDRVDTQYKKSGFNPMLPVTLYQHANI